MPRLLPRFIAPIATATVVALSLLTAAPAFAASNASLSGFVYVDANDDGVHQATEAGIQGVTVTLTGTDMLGNAVDLTTTSHADGSYSFTGLNQSGLSGYTVTETQPAAYLDGQDTRGTAGGTASNDLISGISLADGQAATGYTFGEVQPASLDGFVYQDSNDNGVKDASEPGIAGVTIFLNGFNDLGDAVNLTTTTSASGEYSFSNLRPSRGTEYSLTEVQPAGYLDGKDTAGSLGGTAQNDVFSNLFVQSGDAGTGYNFGELLSTSIAGSVFVDANLNQVFDGSDTSVSGVIVRLTGTDDLGNSVNLTTSSASDGSYIFNGLRPSGADGYTVSDTQVPIFQAGPTVVGSEGGSGKANSITRIFAGSGNPATGYDFTELPAGVVVAVPYVQQQEAGSLGTGPHVVAGTTVAFSVTITNTTSASIVYDVAIGLLTVACPSMSIPANSSVSCTATTPSAAPAVQDTPVTVDYDTPGVVHADAYYFGEQVAATGSTTVGGSASDTAPGPLTTPGAQILMTVDNNSNVLLGFLSIDGDGLTGIDCSNVSPLGSGSTSSCFTSVAADAVTSTHAVVAHFGAPDVTDSDGNVSPVTVDVALPVNYQIAPTVTNISPATGSTNGGTSVTITGTSFTGATAVSFGGFAATSFVLNGPTSITAVSPAGTGAVDITVTTPAATSATGNADLFTYVAPPTVTDVSPAHGTDKGGTVVTLTGTGFTGATSVTFGGVTAPTFTVDNATTITVTTPAGVPGAAAIVVTSGGASSTADATFTYDPAAVPPVLGLTGVDPTLGLWTAAILLLTGFGALLLRRKPGNA